MRKGIGLIWALIILILVSTMMVFIAKVAFFSQKHTTMSYSIQRGELFMQSCIENSILAIEGYDRKKYNDCLQNITFHDEKNRFICNVKVLRYYCYGNCVCKNKKIIQTPFSNGYVLLKIIVTSKKDNIKLSKITLQRL